MVQFSTSQSVRRVEDSRFTTGKGTYTDDINVEGQTYGYMLRSPVAHATIASIDCTKARSIDGIIGIVTAKDLEAEGVNSIPCLVPMENRDGSQAPMPKRPVLCSDRVRHVGDNLAFIIAENLSVAKDAAELIEVNYDSLDAIADTAGALESSAPTIHPDAPNNLAFDWGHGEASSTDQAFDEAVHIVSLELINNKLIVNSMEPRGAIAEFDSATGKATLHSCTQGGWLLKDQIANHTLKTEPDNVRVITPDVGGGFGMKSFYYPEQALAVWSSKKFGRPVKWIGERGDSFISDIMGRDHVTKVDLAFNSNYEILGMRVDTIANMGAYLSNFGPFIPTLAAIKVMPGVYDIKALSVRVRGVFTNTVPVDAYRGAGRPESIYMMERLMDKASQQLGVDRVELRRKNFIAATAMPFTTTAGEIYDSGEFERVMDTVT